MKVRIVKRHRINRIRYEVGDVVDFTAGQWLIDQGIAEAADPVVPMVKAPRASAPEVAAPRPQFVNKPSRFGCCGWRK